MGEIKKQFMPSEDRIIVDGFSCHLSCQQIVDRLALHGFLRTRGAVRSRCRTMGLFHPKPRPLPPKKDTPDQKFKRAMLAALKTGKESAVLGVVKDRRPWTLKRIQPERSSGCSSPAALCAEG